MAHNKIQLFFINFPELPNTMVQSEGCGEADAKREAIY